MASARTKHDATTRSGSARVNVPIVAPQPANQSASPQSNAGPGIAAYNKAVEQALVSAATCGATDPEHRYCSLRLAGTQVGSLLGSVVSPATTAPVHVSTLLPQPSSQANERSNVKPWVPQLSDYQHHARITAVPYGTAAVRSATAQPTPLLPPPPPFPAAALAGTASPPHANVWGAHRRSTSTLSPLSISSWPQPPIRAPVPPPVASAGIAERALTVTTAGVPPQPPPVAAHTPPHPSDLPHAKPPSHFMQVRSHSVPPSSAEMGTG